MVQPFLWRKTNTETEKTDLDRRILFLSVTRIRLPAGGDDLL